MRRRMEQLINGRFEYEVPTLILSPEKIDVTVKVGENYRGQLHLGTDEDIKFKGVATVTNPRIVLGEDKYTGTSLQIPFGVDVSGMRDGENTKGFINLETSIGEYQVPVTVRVEDVPVQTSVGEIKNLSDFTALAKSDMREAFRLFRSEAFEHLLEETAPEQITLYRGMSKNPVTYQHVEEFLVGAGQKEPIELHVEEEQVSFYSLASSQKEELQLQRNVWGYLHLEVEAEGDFIEIPKKTISGDEFVGSIYHLEYIIRHDRLGKGRRFGKILLKTVYGVQTIEVVASRFPKARVDVETIKKRNAITLIRDYIDFRLNRVDAKTWGTKTTTVLECIRQMDDYNVECVLYEAYVKYLTGEQSAAKQILRGLETHSFTGDSPEAKAFFLYLCHLMDLISQGQMDVVEKVRQWQQRRQESFGILWILFQMDEDINRTPSKKVYYMENIFDMGCRSPLLYLEAYFLIRRDEGLLKRINGFWKQVLTFIAREEAFTQEIALRAAYLSENERSFSQMMYRILTKAYEQCPSDAVLDAICKLIMKGNPRRKEFFKWYELAVEHDIKITRLYEYYIETMPEYHQKMLPQVIRMYFAYNNTLSDSKKAFVYANVIRNKDVDSNTYFSYIDAMEEFAEKKLLERKISEDYAVIYREFIKDIKRKDIAEAMADILFTYRIYCDDKKVRNVIVCHAPLMGEESYPCIDGVAYISLYTPNAKILFQDEKSRRYVATVDYNLQELIYQDEILNRCVALDVESKGVVLRVCGDEPKETDISMRNIIMFQHAANKEEFTESYKMQIRKKLLEYYSIHAGDDTLNNYLRKIDYRQFAKVDKVLLIEVLIGRGMYKEAFRLVCEYGHEHIAVYKLVRLASRMIDLTEEEPEEELLLLSYYVYRKGKYDERILKYLLANYEGTIDDMCSIRKSGREFFLETYEMDERILRYTMFVRKHISTGGDVLKTYMAQGGRELVTMAYLTFESYGYFQDDIPADPYIFQMLSVAYERQLELDSVCHLALLKYYASLPSLTEKQEEQAESILEEAQAKGLRFAFYQKLPKMFLQPYQLEDRIFVEQKAAPKDRVTLYYSLSGDTEAKSVYKSEPMKRMYRGIFSKEFILFYGETLTYYITVEHNGKVTQMPKTSVTMPKVDMEGRSKYQLINQMLAAKTLGKEDTLKERVLQYRQAEKITDELFELTK